MQVPHIQSESKAAARTWFLPSNVTSCGEAIKVRSGVAFWQPKMEWKTRRRRREREKIRKEEGEVEAAAAGTLCITRRCQLGMRLQVLFVCISP